MELQGNKLKSTTGSGFPVTLWSPIATESAIDNENVSGRAETNKSDVLSL
jgi:hypothetical protein